MLGASGGMKTSLIIVGMTPVLHDSYFKFMGNVDASISACVFLIKSRVVNGTGPFSASH